MPLCPLNCNRDLPSNPDESWKLRTQIETMLKNLVSRRTTTSGTFFTLGGQFPIKGFCFLGRGYSKPFFQSHFRCLIQADDRGAISECGISAHFNLVDDFVIPILNKSCLANRKTALKPIRVQV